jgi:hypothetical protein
MGAKPAVTPVNDAAVSVGVTENMNVAKALPLVFNILPFSGEMLKSTPAAVSVNVTVPKVVPAGPHVPVQ